VFAFFITMAYVELAAYTHRKHATGDTGGVPRFDFQFLSVRLLFVTRLYCVITTKSIRQQLRIYGGLCSNSIGSIRCEFVLRQLVVQQIHNKSNQWSLSIRDASFFCTPFFLAQLREHSRSAAYTPLILLVQPFHWTIISSYLELH